MLGNRPNYPSHFWPRRRHTWCGVPHYAGQETSMTYQPRPRPPMLGIFMLTVTAAFAQPAPRIEFEGASIKPAAPITNKEGKFRVGMRVDAVRMDYIFVSLRECIQTAYRVKDYQIQGPAWLADTRF